MFLSHTDVSLPLSLSLSLSLSLNLPLSKINELILGWGLKHNSLPDILVSYIQMMIIIFTGKISEAMSLTKSILLTDPGNWGLPFPFSGVGGHGSLESWFQSDLLSLRETEAEARRAASAAHCCRSLAGGTLKCRCSKYRRQNLGLASSGTSRSKRDHSWLKPHSKHAAGGWAAIQRVSVVSGLTRAYFQDPPSK